MRDEIFKLLEEEKGRQLLGLELIASENIVSNDVLKAVGSLATNKYAEGYANKRYYGGCEIIDKIELLAIERAKKLFDCKYVNVQPHCGSSANMAAYKSLVNKRDKILGMNLSSGGHLTHGLNINFSGEDYNFISYDVNELTGMLDYEEIRKIALEEKPDLIVAGASAYSREIDFKKFREIADEVGAFLMVDMAHIAGLVAAKLHMSPIPYADVVTTTTHKTLRGPRGGMILTNNEQLADKINKVIFPGIQGGPLMHVIAGKAVAFGEALQDEFVEYQKQVLSNTKTLASELQKLGYKIVSDGTDNHMFLVDLSDKNITGKQAEKILVDAGITVNKNMIPFDKQSPFVTSGIRIGTATLTTRGMKEEEMKQIASLINRVITGEDYIHIIKNDVEKLVSTFPLFKQTQGGD